MAEDELFLKLKSELEKEIDGEPQVVYILSRIRKILELKKLKEKYKYLNFYCNWALHSKMDRTEPVKTILREFLKLDQARMKFPLFEYLKEELQSFLENNSLPDRIVNDQWTSLREKLLDIYSDTPVEVYPEEKVTIKIKRPEHSPGEGEFSVAFSVERKFDEEK